MAWSGIAKVGSKTEWPPWHPTPGEISRDNVGVPKFVAPGTGDNPMGSRALYLYSGGKDTLFPIHGTNQPEYIGASISSGCIRMTNEDVIDLYDRVGVSVPSWWCWSRSTATRRSIREMALQGGGNSGPLRRWNDNISCDDIKPLTTSKAPVLPALFLLRASSGSGPGRPVSDFAPSDGGDRRFWRRRIRRLGLVGIWRRPRAAALPQAAPPATAARPAASGHTIPLADPVIVAPSHQVKMDVVLVVPVRAWTGRLKTARIRNAGRSRATTRHGAIGQRDRVDR